MCYCDVRILQTKSTMYKQCKQNSRNFAKKVLVIKLDPPKDFDKSTRLSSRTDFEVLGLGLEGQVLGLGLEASSPRKLACPRLEDSTIFWNVKILWSAWKIFWKTFFSGDRLKNFCEDLFFFFFLEIAWKIFVKTFFFFILESTCALCPWFLALASSIPVLGLESVCPRKGCPWPWPRIFFVSLALALALASSLVSSTPPLLKSANTNSQAKIENSRVQLQIDCLRSANKFCSKNLHTWCWKRALQAVVQAQYLQTTNTVPFSVKLHWNWLINALELTEIWLKSGIPIKSIVGCIENNFWKFWI